ncbi:MAG: DUF4397 domain-containing protein [Burkholderiales bacterium]|nr:DUF4397 domain-containing protein [Burkholderiales bacterium]
MRNTLIRLFLAAAASTTLLASCGGGDVSPNAGEVRLVNATSEFGALDLYEGSDRLTPGVASFAVGNYEDLNKGGYTFSVRGGVAGATIATLDASVAKNTHQAIVAYSNGGTPTLTMIDEEEDDADKGSAKLRFFNTAATDSGNVDIYLLDIANACSTLNGTAATPIATGVSGLQSGFTTINPSPAAGYRLCVTAATDKTDIRLDTALVVGDRRVVTVILSRSSGVLLNGLILVQQGALTQALNSSARVRLAVGVTTGNTVTASVGGVSLGLSSIPRTITSYKLVPSGTVTADVSISGATSVPTSITLVGGTDYTLLVAGTSSVPTLITDNNALSANTAKPVKIRLVNGTNGALTGALGPAQLAVGSTRLEYTEFAAASPYIFVESSTATAITLDVRTTTNAVLCTSTSTLPAAAGVFTVFVLGDVPPQAPAAPPICLLVTDR